MADDGAEEPPAGRITPPRERRDLRRARDRTPEEDTEGDIPTAYSGKRKRSRRR